jgi:general secretion pathway protein C
LDWAHYFRFSLSDFKGLFSQKTVILTLTAILLYQAVGIFYNALTLQLLWMTPPPAAVAEAQPAAVAAREPVDAYKMILEKNIFGTTTKSIEEKQAETTPQQDITLLFDLRGTVAGEGKYGFAIIEEKASHKQRLIRIGDVVSGARILRIRRNALDVLIDDNERTLKMAERTEAPIVPPSSGKTMPVASTVSDGSIILNRSDISTALSDMGSMLRQAQVRPFFKAGVPEGFMISNIRAGSLYQAMGIVDGDIIQGVDGRKIQTADDMTAFYETMKKGSGMALSLERGGKQQTLNYQFR